MLRVVVLVSGGGTNLQAVIDKIASVVNRQRAYVSTETLQSLDITRDNGCRTVINIADASKTSLVPEKNAASAHLRPQLSSYKKTPYHEYAKQTLETAAAFV